MHYWMCVPRISLMDVISQTMTALKIRSIRHEHPKAPVSRAIAMNGAWLDPPGSAAAKAAAQLSTETPELVDNNRTTEERVSGRFDSSDNAGGTAIERFDMSCLLPSSTGSKDVQMRGIERGPHVEKAQDGTEQVVVACMPFGSLLQAVPFDARISQECRR